MGRTLSSHKFIKKSFKCLATSTKQFLNAGRGHQAHRNAVHSLRKEGGQKTKRETKELGMETNMGRESCRRRSFQTAGNPLTSASVGNFGISEGNITGRREKKKKKQNMFLTTTQSREVTQTITSTTSKQGLDRNLQAACLG